jgi:hypothetical protein
MSYQIQRLTFGGILDQGFRLMRDHFVTLTAGFLFVFVPYHVLAYALQAAGHGQPSALVKLGGALLSLALFSLAMPFGQLMVTWAILQAYLGHTVDVASSMRAARQRYWSYVGTSMLGGLGILGGFFLLVVPGVYFAIVWSVIGPVMVLEDVYGKAALTRSRALVTGYFGRAFGTMFVATFLITAISGSLNAIFSLIPWLGAVLSGGVAAVGATYSTAALVALYVDLRCRHENFDLQLMAEQVAAVGGASANTTSGKWNAPAA